MRHQLAAPALLIVLFAGPAPALARNLPAPESPTWREEAANSSLVLYGTLTNARENAGTTDILISHLIKPHRILGNRKVLRMDRFVQIDPQKDVRMLIFCDVFKGKIDPYRGIRVSSAAIPYLMGLLHLDARDPTQRLHYCFQFLNHPDPEIASDAFREFAKTPDRELGIAARKLSPRKLLGWLKDPKTPSYQVGLYAILLGHCGGRTDALFLRALAEKRIKDQATSGMDKILAASMLLAPKDGHAFTCKVLRNPANEFTVRYAALRAVRYIHDIRPGVLSRKDLLQAMKIALVHEDMNDLPIEDLRRWHSWELTARILPLYGKPSKSLPILRRAILRYALQCSGPEAAAFLADRRKAEPACVKDAEEWLKLEQAQP
jgi:hypothetical protein